MRLTKAQRLFGAAILVPVSLTFVWGFVSAIAARPSDDRAMQVGDAVSFAIFLLGPPTLVTLALFASKPASDFWKQARQNTLVCLAILWSFGGLAVGCGLIFDPEFDAAVLFLPLGIWTFVEAYRDERMNAGFLLHNAVAAAVMFLIGGVVITLAIASQAMGSTLLSRLLSFVLPTFLIALLACTPLNAALRWNARRRGEREVRFAPGFYMPLNRWNRLSDADAEGEWRAVGSIPGGGTLVGAWAHKDVPSVKLECKGPQGERWLLFRNAPTTPWPQWIAGPFVKASRNGDSGLNLRMFEKVGCVWKPYLAEGHDAESSAFASTRFPAAWTCSDCSAHRFDFTDVDGSFCLAFTNLPDEPEPEWYAGLFFIWARAPEIAPRAEVAPVDTP